MRLRSSLAGLLTLSAVITACGSTTPEAGDKSEKVAISYAIWDKNNQPGLQQVIDSFQKKHPNISVKLELTPWDQYWTKLQTAVTGGAAADVFWMNPLNLPLYAKNNVIAPVDESKIDISGFPKAVTDGHRFGGKLYGTPMDVSVIGLWYNKELFDQGGVKYPTADWTWDDLKAAAKKLTVPDKKQYGLLSTMWDQGVFYNTVFQNGGYIISPTARSRAMTTPPPSRVWSSGPTS